MKKFILIGFIALIGCTPAKPTTVVVLPQQPLKEKTEEKKEEKPQENKPDGLLSRLDGRDFKIGYIDGYTKSWVRPFGYFFNDFYRNGHALGVKDREDGKPNRYEVK